MAKRLTDEENEAALEAMAMTLDEAFGCDNLYQDHHELQREMTLTR